MTSRRWRAGNVVLWGVILLLATGFTSGLAVLLWDSGWIERIGWIGRTLMVAYFGAHTFKKLRSDAPVDDDWSAHGAYVVMALLALLIGAQEVVDPRFSRLVGLVGVGAAALMLFAARRDISRWRRAPRPVREPRKRMTTGPRHLRPR